MADFIELHEKEVDNLLGELIYRDLVLRTHHGKYGPAWKKTASDTRLRWIERGAVARQYLTSKGYRLVSLASPVPPVAAKGGRG